MNFWVGVTDNDWFNFLSKLRPDEVNFWTPSGRTFRAIDEGELFLFKLKSPFNHIAGGGFFVRYTKLPISLAWDVFKEKNGLKNYEDFYLKIKQYRDLNNTMVPNPIIGNIVLTQPFFFPEEEWIPVPDDWARSIQTGKTYDTNDRIGGELWDSIQTRLFSYTIEESKDIAEKPRYGEEYKIRPRLGQGGFRIVVTEVYKRRCAFTGEKALPVLQASHIKPFAKSGPHLIQNGLLLRADLHILFDQGYFTITDDHYIEASKSMKDDFNNGEEYLRLHGQSLSVLPENFMDLPSASFIAWHQENVYKG